MQPEVPASPLAFPALLDQPLGPAWDFGVAAQYTILKHFREVLKWPDEVRRNVDVEAVHQIRVASRRTRTALQTFTPLWPEDQVREFSKLLARFADAFGMSRDLDVMLIYLRAQLESAKGDRAEAYTWLLARNTAAREAEQPRLIEALAEFEGSGLPVRFVDYFSHQPYDLHAKGVPYG